jgi:hypothetical protein
MALGALELARPRTAKPTQVRHVAQLEDLGLAVALLVALVLVLVLVLAHVLVLVSACLLHGVTSIALRRPERKRKVQAEGRSERATRYTETIDTVSETNYY